MPLKIVMFFDFICPFCFIGFEVIRKLKPEFEVEVDWRGFQIHPEWPADGVLAADYRRGTDPQVRRARWQQIEAMAGAAGFTMRQPELLANSRLALEAAEFAKESGAGEAFEQRIYEAYFQDGLNIGDAGVLANIAADLGMDRDDFNLALESNRYTARLRNNTVMAHQLGVSGVPTFFIGQYPLVGAQSEQVMRQVLERAAQRAGSAK
jgi:predicted DsbA family dithiol-disulfide isomerase